MILKRLISGLTACVMVCAAAGSVVHTAAASFRPDASVTTQPTGTSPAAAASRARARAACMSDVRFMVYPLSQGRRMPLGAVVYCVRGEAGDDGRMISTRS